ncbi:MAG: hypothetical protein C0616_02770 [Desulfuromonas sp.]|nr:MAG: hypothetical protein C0616_02770 [Desulfuromonas sp.]
MKRRGFLQTGLVAAGAALALPVRTFGADCADMAGGLYYTVESPGRWAAKAAGHAPNVSVRSGADGAILQVVTGHEMKPFEHYIIKHVVLNDRFRFVSETMFDPTSGKAPVSEFHVGNYRGKLYVLSVCNKHDTWLKEVDLT